jgi:hypothetical protein
MTTLPRDLTESFLIRLYEKMEDGEAFAKGDWAGRNIRETVEALSDEELTREYFSYAC